jgi:3'5'-cyclic nucleotide phosphodiesterase
LSVKDAGGKKEVNSSQKDLNKESLLKVTFKEKLDGVAASAEEIKPNAHLAERRMSKIVQDPRSIYPPELEEINSILSCFNDYDFNLFELARISGNHSLYLLSHHLFTQSKLFESFSIPVEKFSSCIEAIERGYHSDLPCNGANNLDHNSLHAADVLHCVHILANTGKMKEIWSDMELLAMYFAAIIHDHDHPGVTNNFLVTTSDPKAVLYNDKAVLENHHCASSFLVMARPENNFLSQLTKAEFKSLREIVVDLVLATGFALLIFRFDSTFYPSIHFQVQGCQS